MYERVDYDRFKEVMTKKWHNDYSYFALEFIFKELEMRELALLSSLSFNPIDISMSFHEYESIEDANRDIYQVSELTLDGLDGDKYRYEQELMDELTGESSVSNVFKLCNGHILVETVK